MVEKASIAAEVGNDFFASINFVHGERSERVARALSGLLLMQKSLIEATASNLFDEGATRREVEVVIKRMGDSMSKTISAAVYLMTEDMSSEEREAFTSILIKSVKAMSSVLEVKQ